jgi:tRNA(Ile)-lysidine synthase
LAKGAGVVEMVAMEEWEEREGYRIWRPFAFTPRSQIEEYLRSNSLPHFRDRSNEELTYFRNFIRHRFATPFIERFEAGVARSFRYLEKDKSHLLPPPPRRVGECYFFDRTDPHRDLRLVDRVVKRLGVVMSEAQRREVVNQNFSVVVGGKVAVDTNGRKIFIAPFVKIPLGRWRERCRVLKIPPKVRGYLVKEGLCGILSTEIFTDVWRSGRS